MSESYKELEALECKFQSERETLKETEKWIDETLITLKSFRGMLLATDEIRGKLIALLQVDPKCTWTELVPLIVARFKEISKLEEDVSTKTSLLEQIRDIIGDLVRSAVGSENVAKLDLKEQVDFFAHRYMTLDSTVSGIVLDSDTSVRDTPREKFIEILNIQNENADWDEILAELETFVVNKMEIEESLRKCNYLAADYLDKLNSALTEVTSIVPKHLIKTSDYSLLDYIRAMRQLVPEQNQ